MVKTTETNGYARLWHVLIVVWIGFLAAISVSVFLAQENRAAAHSEISGVQTLIDLKITNIQSDLEEIKKDVKALLQEKRESW